MQATSLKHIQLTVLQIINTLKIPIQKTRTHHNAQILIRIAQILIQNA